MEAEEGGRVALRGCVAPRFARVPSSFSAHESMSSATSMSSLSTWKYGKGTGCNRISIEAMHSPKKERAASSKALYTVSCGMLSKLP